MQLGFRGISHRLLVGLLTLMMGAFPVVTAAATERCEIECAEEHVAVETCCSKSEAPPQDEPRNPGKHTGCAGCLAACCRAADVTHVPTRLLLEHAVITPVIRSTESVYQSFTADAIFHPPRV